MLVFSWKILKSKRVNIILLYNKGQFWLFQNTRLSNNNNIITFFFIMDIFPIMIYRILESFGALIQHVHLLNYIYLTTTHKRCYLPNFNYKTSYHTSDSYSLRLYFLLFHCIENTTIKRYFPQNNPYNC